MAFVETEKVLILRWSACRPSKDGRMVYFFKRPSEVAERPLNALSRRFDNAFKKRQPVRAAQKRGDDALRVRHHAEHVAGFV